MMMTDESAATVWEGEYLPFGEEHSITGSITNNLRFPGQYYDSETELHYNYFRDYKPEIGRYLESDPIGLEGGVNPYVYVLSNPCKRIDLNGLWSGADAELFKHFYLRLGGYLDISESCGDYLADPMVQAQTTLLKQKIDLQARKLVKLKGISNFVINQGKSLDITSIYSFGTGNNHKQTAVCQAEGDGCCVSVNCKLRYSARDQYDDPIDLCQTLGVCSEIRNVAGKAFGFGLSCSGSYGTRKCKK
jgi:RHS repeat-associated protein